MKVIHSHPFVLLVVAMTLSKAFAKSKFYGVGFVPAKARTSCPHGLSRTTSIPSVRIGTPLTAKGKGDRDGDDDDELANAKRRNEARVDVRNLLTQRAIQSFMYLLTSLRDPHSGKWIEDVLETSNQLEFHGTGAAYMQRFGGTWDAPLIEMMERPKDKVIVKLRRRARSRKGFNGQRKKKNPYLKDKFMEFEIDIDPASLVTRILSVREQIAKEWATVDLDIVAAANNQILDSYFKLAREQRNKTDVSDDIANATQSTNQEIVFERTAYYILNNNTRFVDGSSPFRKGNFDLLYNLCTQASIHRVLHDLAEAGESKEVSFKWLRDFYTDRVASYFDGHQPFGRADDFLDELLRTSPSLVYLDDGKSAGLVDPLRLAELIIQTRNEVVKEWKESMENVPTDHASGIRKALLEKQMAAWGSMLHQESSFE